MSCYWPLLLLWPSSVWGHASLIEPPSRAAMWDYGFPENPVDYQHNEGFCGGFAYQFSAQIGGKCGLCGDAWDISPKEHEAPGGKYANGIITRSYVPGDDIMVTVLVTANHKGYFTFKLCKNDNVDQDPDQSCFEELESLLRISPTGENRFMVTTEMGTGPINVTLRLPEWTCEQCILQWTYTAGNSWGDCGDGTGGLGCGPQEHFRACSDISLSGDPAGQSTLPPITTPTPPPTPSPSPTPTPLPSPSPPPPTSGTCVAIGSWSGDSGMANWCFTSCFAAVPYCPEDRCQCVDPITQAKQCHATGAWTGNHDMDEWCKLNCNLPQPFCPSNMCTCGTGGTSPTPGPTTVPPSGSCVAVGAWEGQSSMAEWCELNCFAPTPFCPSDRCQCSGGSSSPTPSPSTSPSPTPSPSPSPSPTTTTPTATGNECSGTLCGTSSTEPLTADIESMRETASCTLSNDQVELISPGLSSNPANVKNVENTVSETKFNELFPNRNPAYTYSNFLKSVGKYPAICSSADLCPKVLANMFAHFQQETAGLYYVEEINRGGYCADWTSWVTLAYPCFPGKKYYGRGAKQLSWNYNYGAFSSAMFGDASVLLNQPELVATTWLNFAASMWFFVTPQPPKPSMLQVLTGQWTPNSDDLASNLQPGLGLTTMIINGALECGSTPSNSQAAGNRATYYQNFAQELGVDTSGEELLCDNMQPFTSSGSAGQLTLFWAPESGCQLVTWQTAYSALVEGDYNRCQGLQVPCTTAVPGTPPPAPSPTVPLVTTTPPPVTTTPPPRLDCWKKDNYYIIRTIKTIKKVKNVWTCAKKCSENSACEFYKYKKSGKLAKRICYLQKLGYKKQKNLYGGHRVCP